jgi:hypothetical protein
VYVKVACLLTLFRWCPLLLRLFGLEKAGKDDEGACTVWVFKTNRDVPLREITGDRDLQLFWRCCTAFASKIVDIDLDADKSFAPVIAIKKVCICERIIIVHPGWWLHAEDKNGAVVSTHTSVDEPNVTVYLTLEGTKSIPTSFEEGAHAHQRKLKRGKSARYRCHSLILSALMRTDLFELVNAVDRAKLDDRYADYLTKCRRGKEREIMAGVCDCRGGDDVH